MRGRQLCMEGASTVGGGASRVWRVYRLCEGAPVVYGEGIDYVRGASFVCMIIPFVRGRKLRI